MKVAASSTSMGSTATSPCSASRSSAARSTGSAASTCLPCARPALASPRSRPSSRHSAATNAPRAREIDLLRYQVDELDHAQLDAADEDRTLELEEDRLADAVAHREAAAQASDALTGEGGAVDALGVARSALVGRSPFAELEERLHGLEAEAADIAADLRHTADAIADDPERLNEVRGRRHLLRELTRKYGETLEEVIAYRDEARERLAVLSSHDARAAALDEQRTAALAAADAEARRVGDARRAAAPKLASAVRSHLTELALPRARIDVAVDGDAGDAVTYLLAANPGEDLAPLARVASGGELARTMLALRLVVTEAPPTLVFDEVDAGIGGQAALAVGRSLAIARCGASGARRDTPRAGRRLRRRPGRGRQARGEWAHDGQRICGRRRCPRGRAVTDAVGHALERDRPRSRRGAACRRRPRARPLTV